MEINIPQQPNYTLELTIEELTYITAVLGGTLVEEDIEQIKSYCKRNHLRDDKVVSFAQSGKAMKMYEALAKTVREAKEQL